MDKLEWPWMQIPKFCELTGYTEKAVKRKIEDGKWGPGIWRKAPDGHVMISIEGYNAWVEGAKAAA